MFGGEGRREDPASPNTCVGPKQTCRRPPTVRRRAIASTDIGVEGNGRTPMSTTSSSPRSPDDARDEGSVRSPKWFTRKVRQVCDGRLVRSGRYRDTVRSETVIPSFSKRLSTEAKTVASRARGKGQPGG